MLRKLTVENYILIESLEMDLSPGLNIITGETGAGKSILLGALGLLSGNRCDTSVIRDKERNCIIEGTFDITGYGLEWFFDGHDLDYDPSTVIRRVITPAGKSRSYINDLPVQQTMLKEFGGYLIDIHSQHQSLLLSRDGFRIGILDSAAGNSDLLNQYKTVYNRLRSAQRDLEALRTSEERNRQDEEWLRYQVDELDKAKLNASEKAELEKRLGELANAEEIKTKLTIAGNCLGDEQTGILVNLKTAEQALLGISEVYGNGSEYAARIRTTLIELRDVERELSADADRIEADPALLQITSDRLDMIYSLEQKHRVSSVEELIVLQKEYESRLHNIESSARQIAETEKMCKTLHTEATALADKLSAGRKAAGEKLSAHVAETLARLGMPSGKFVVDVSFVGELRPTGSDDVRFLFSSNANIDPAPVEKIASGGEISRVMLALKSLAARNSNLPTIIFDEIDTGVSGKTADAMGDIICELGAGMQVVNITHLPQVASKGDTHFVVCKQSDGAVPTTGIRKLDPMQRVDEIATMLSGSTITDAARAQAKTLLGF